MLMRHLVAMKYGHIFFDGLQFVGPCLLMRHLVAMKYGHSLFLTVCNLWDLVCSLIRSNWRMLLSVSDAILQYMMLSSAKSMGD